GHLLQNERPRHARGEAMVVRHGHRQAPARLARDEPRLLEQPDALAHGRAVDAELRDELGLGADRVTRLEPAGENLALDRLRDQLVGRPGLDPLEPGGDLCHLRPVKCGRRRRSVPAAAIRVGYWLGLSLESTSPNSSNDSPFTRARRTAWIG